MHAERYFDSLLSWAVPCKIAEHSKDRKLAVHENSVNKSSTSTRLQCSLIRLRNIWTQIDTGGSIIVEWRHDVSRQCRSL